jgi:RND superfamily putative drug exporter
VAGRIAALAIGRRSRWLVIVVWLVLAAALAPLQPKLQLLASDESDTFFTRGSESQLVDRLLGSRFPESGESVATVLWASADGESIYKHTPKVSDYANKICGSYDRLPALKGVGSPEGPVCGELGHVLGPRNPPPVISTDESMILMSVFNSRDDTESVAADVETLRDILPGPDARPLRSYVTGEAGFDADRSAAVEGLDGTLLAITGVLVLVLMLLTYRSPLIAALMLGVVAVAYVISSGIVYGLASADLTTVSGQSTAILIVLMFGSGTDYCLLIVSRFRDELRRSADIESAMTRAAARSGPAIMASGSIVVAAMLVLTLADFNATREMGPLLALGILVMMAAGATLLPALLAAFGPRAFWPATPRPEAVPRDAHPGWKRVSAFVQRRPARLVTVTTLVLGLGALGNLEGREFLNVAKQYRDPPESAQAADLIAKHYDPPGRVGPIQAVAEAGVALDVKDALAAVPGIVHSYTDSSGTLENGKEIVSINALFEMDPYSEQAQKLVPKAREAARKAAGNQLAAVGGVTAEVYDNQSAIISDTKLIVPLVLLVIFLVLVVLLRAVVAPLYVIGTVVLSFAFALGASSLIFTHIFGQPASDPNLALFSFMFLVALGVDDNIFLMSRVREEHRRGVPTRTAIVAGLEKTGGVITSAGLILAGTFAALMALELEALFQIGFTVSLGLLIDAFIVRIYFVPAIALLLGERNWWPSRA